MVELLEALAHDLVPQCDPEVIRTVFETASSGYAGPRTRDGRRASALTPTGVPLELNLSVGDERPEAALRYVTETASGQPFFRPRLDAQRACLDQLVRWLPGDHQMAAAEVRAFVDLLFPDPAAVPARTRFATFVGVVHEPEAPWGLSWLKVYGSSSVEGSLDRLAARWPAFADLRVVVDGIPLRRAFAALELSADGARRHKLYCRPRSDSRRAADELAARCGVDLGDVVGALGELGVGVGRWHKVLAGCEARQGRPPGLTLYLPAKSLVADDAPGDGGWGIDDLGVRLARRLHASAAWSEQLGRVLEHRGGRWQHTGLGLGLRAGGGIGKLNVYVVAPDMAGVLTG